MSVDFDFYRSRKVAFEYAFKLATLSSSNTITVDSILDDAEDIFDYLIGLNESDEDDCCGDDCDHCAAQDDEEAVDDLPF